jgi:hypothetical protein
VNHCKPRELGVASANHHSWLDSHVILARSWFWGSTKKPSMTSSCCSCHHAVRIWPRRTPGPLNQAYLSAPHLEASLTSTFHVCSSPALAPIKPQPAPTILSQESVHTTLSITHHIRKRPSTGPRATQALNNDTLLTGWCVTTVSLCVCEFIRDVKKYQQHVGTFYSWTHSCMGDSPRFMTFL